MKIKAGFRAVLTVGAVLIGATLSALAFSQYAFFADTSRSERLDQVVQSGTRLAQLTNEVLLYGEPRSLAQWQEQYDEFGLRLRDGKIASDAELTIIVGLLINRYSDLLPLYKKLADARGGDKSGQVAAILASQLFQEATQLQASLRNLRQISEEGLKSAYRSSKQRQIAIFSLFAGLIVIYGVTVSVLFHAAILKPLGNLERTIMAIRDGVCARARIRAQDEIGIVCQTFNHLLDEQESSHREIEAMAERFKNVFEQVAVGMAIVSKNGAWMEVNDCLCAMLGFKREDFLGSTYARFVHPEDSRRDQAIANALLRDEKRSESWETRFVRKNGKTIWARMSVALARDGDERPLYFMLVVEDITERMAADAKIREFNRQLEEQALDLKRTNADLESFAWVASHDLREPLRMVSSYVDLIGKRLGDQIDEDTKCYIGYAVDGAKRMDALILDLLDYSRVGRRGGTLESVSLADAAAESLINLKVMIEETGARVDLARDLPIILGLRSEVVRLFQNLIGNAIKFRKPGQAPVVTVGCRLDGGEWIVSVADNGIGIDPQYHEKIFRIFQRLVTKDQYEGTGIGLAICKKIVDRLGGRIWVESTLGEGCAFFIAFPKPQDTV